MALFNRVGSVLRSNVQSPTLTAVRFMSTKIFVGGLSYGTDEQYLKQAFANFGEVIDAKIITDRDTGRSRGFGFVNFASEDEAKSAQNAMNGQELDGRNVTVAMATERPPRSTFGGGYGGGNRGGYGGGNSGGYGGGNSGGYGGAASNDY